ncbi:hypothetical protein [Caballeronia sp. LZ043]|uniref:hypothetical protein n=1 Tax=Caballeronia sp. LZ043 TaxID=3038569 RepID=UPI00285D3698|nr:hypothetical protein [Caballeronia sp. LZ043]MDR5825056.1 hypothetical protein [Caballeronia sp. LZ043]
MIRKAVRKLCLVASALLASLLAALAMTRFANLRAGAIPDWMADGVRATFEAMSDRPVGIESIIDGSLLFKLAFFWLMAALVMTGSLLAARRLLHKPSLGLACSAGAFPIAWFLAHCVHLASTTFNGVRKDSQILYVSGLLLACWVGMVMVLLAVLALRSRRSAQNNQKKDD